MPLSEKKSTGLATLRSLKTGQEIFLDSEDGSDYSRRMRQLRQMLHHNPASRRQVMRLIRSVVLRHTCRRMRSDDIVRILREGRDNNPYIDHEMRALRRSLDQRALLCKLRKGRWVPLQDGDTKRKKKKKGKKKKKQRKTRKVKHRQLRMLPTSFGQEREVCSLPRRFTDRGVIERLKKDMMFRKCWNDKLERRYKIIKYFQHIGNVLDDNMLFSSSLCFLKKKYNQCSVSMATREKYENTLDTTS